MNKPHENVATPFSNRQKIAMGALLGATTLGLSAPGANAETLSQRADRLDLNHVAGVIVRAEAKMIRHNTGLKGRITIHCGVNPGPGYRKCTMFVYSRTHDRLKTKVKISWKPVKPHVKLIFEDYTGYVTVDGLTLKIANND